MWCYYIDFTTFDNFIKHKESNLGSKRIEYIIDLAIAKEMAMPERNEKGKQANKQTAIEIAREVNP